MQDATHCEKQNVRAGDETANPCSVCGRYHAPSLTADAVIFDPARGVVLVRRKNVPVGWALPGGFVDYGETVEQAAVREALEETGLDVALTGLVGVYSDPARDARTHTVSAAFAAAAKNPESIAGGDDAEEARFFSIKALPADIVFDHRKIIDDFVQTLYP